MCLILVSAHSGCLMSSSVWKDVILAWPGAWIGSSFQESRFWLIPLWLLQVSLPKKLLVMSDSPTPGQMRQRQVSPSSLQGFPCTMRCEFHLWRISMERRMPMIIWSIWFIQLGMLISPQRSLLLFESPMVHWWLWTVWRECVSRQRLCSNKHLVREFIQSSQWTRWTGGFWNWRLVGE